MVKQKKPSVRSQLYRDLKDKVNRKVFRKYEMPWMKSKELDIITEVLTNLNPRHCFEWGSGFSTLLLPGLLPNLEHWHSLEHHKEWYEFVKNEIQDKRVHLELVEPDNMDYFNIKDKFNARLDGLYEDFKSYVEFPIVLNKKFDFIFIDGRARSECLKRAYALVTDTGVVVVHDANRDDYFTDFPPFSSTFRLTDYRKPKKRGGIWIGRKTGKVSDILDIEHHQRIWKEHDRIAKTLFLR